MPAHSASEEQSGRQKLPGGDIGGASADFGKARELDPRSAEAVAGLGETAFEQGNYDEAIGRLRQASKLAPRKLSYQVLLAQSLYKAGRHADAVDTCKRILKQNPNQSEAKQILELAQQKLGQ